LVEEGDRFRLNNGRQGGRLLSASGVLRPAKRPAGPGNHRGNTHPALTGTLLELPEFEFACYESRYLGYLELSILAAKLLHYSKNPYYSSIDVFAILCLCEEHLDTYNSHFEVQTHLL
jgi:hypothetical protein